MKMNKDILRKKQKKLFPEDLKYRKFFREKKIIREEI